MSHSKLSLLDPMRNMSIKNHRETLHRCRANPVPRPSPSIQCTTFPYELYDRDALRHRFSQRFKEVTISILKQGAYDSIEKFIELTIIDEPFMEKELAIGDYPTPKNFLVEDKNKEVITLQIDGLPENENIWKMFTVGTVLAVVDCRIISTSTNNSRIGGNDNAFIYEDESTRRRIYVVGRKVDICRYCGEEHAKQKCGNCGVLYCSRGCQVADWKLKHKLICKDKAMEMETEKVNLEQSLMSKEELRISRIINFRKSYNIIFHRFYRPATLIVKDPKSGFLLPEMENPLNPEPIFLKDMTCDNIYTGRLIELKIIEEPCFGFAELAIHSIVEDKNKDIASLTINGLAHPENLSARVKFQVGTRFSVVNPYYKIGDVDGVPMIRVDHLKSILGLKENCNVCRCCGEDYTRGECSVCKRRYCGKECQDRDLRLMRHDLICETGAGPMNVRSNQIVK